MHQPIYPLKLDQVLCLEDASFPDSHFDVVLVYFDELFLHLVLED